MAKEKKDLRKDRPKMKTVMIKFTEDVNGACRKDGKHKFTLPTAADFVLKGQAVPEGKEAEEMLKETVAMRKEDLKEAAKAKE